jgi:hypothetical protein
MTNIIDHAQAAMGNAEWGQNWTLDGLEFYGEIMELATLNVWLCQQSFTLEEYEALEPPEGFIKSGMGRSSHDAAYFRRPPAESKDGPLETMTVNGRRFSHVAMPGKNDPNYSLKRDKLLLIEIHKHHSVMFAKGRKLEILSIGDGMDYVPQVTEITGMPWGLELAERILPDGWSVREITLKEDLFVEIPFPAKVCFFASGDSFQGPVKLNNNL